jgi:SnoaL-like domain
MDDRVRGRMSDTENTTQRWTRLATTWSRALDAEDYAAARPLLAPDCVYDMPRGRLVGPDAILASYADVARWVARAFDEVRYESACDAPQDSTVSILFTDYLFKVGVRWHRHRCRQEITFSNDGLITRIVHRDLPGEAETLEEFLAACGIERPA